MNKYLLILATTSMFAFTACNSDDDKIITPSLTKTQLLTGKTWKLTAHTTVLTDSSGTKKDTFLSECKKDDIYIFMPNNHFIRQEGTSKCYPSDPETETGTWAFTDNETKLNITSDGVASTGELIELTSSTLIVKTTNNFSSNTKLEKTDTYTPQ